MNPPVFAALNVAPVRSLVGTNPVRVYQGKAPEGVAKPYIVWQIVGGGPVNNLADDPEMDDARVRVWSYTDPTAGTAAARNLALAVRTALEAVTHVVFGPVDEVDDPTGMIVWIMDAEFWTER